LDIVIEIVEQHLPFADAWDPLYVLIKPPPPTFPEGGTPFV
jgi:hypothetical protein